MTRLDKRGRRIGRNWWREHCMALFRDDTDAWEKRAEAITLGYATETIEYKQTNPMPTLKTCLVHNAGMSPR